MIILLVLFLEATTCDLSAFEPHVLTSALKKLLRELPDPLIPSQWYDAFIEASRKNRVFFNTFKITNETIDFILILILSQVQIGTIIVLLICCDSCSSCPKCIESLCVHFWLTCVVCVSGNTGVVAVNPPLCSLRLLHTSSCDLPGSASCKLFYIFCVIIWLL